VRRAAVHGGLQRADDVGIPGVRFASVHVLEQSARIERGRRIEGRGDAFALLGLEIGEAGAADAPACRRNKVDDFAVESDDLEQLRGAVAGDRRDAHLRDDLEQALADALAIAAAEFARLAAAIAKTAAAAEVEQRLIGEERINRGRAEADQAGEVVRVARGAGLDQKVAVAAQLRLDQRPVDRASGQQGVDRQLARLRRRIAVAEEYQTCAGAYGRGGLRAQARERSFESFALVVVQVDETLRVREAWQREDLAQLALRQHRRGQHDLSSVLGESSNRLPSGPTCVTSDITAVSRSGSIGGLVTCANACRK
jgi:hypothetical protein